MPATLLMAGLGFIPFTVYLCSVPLSNWIWHTRLETAPIAISARE
ncbi:MAG: hypothetical protein AAGA46_15545 [Cyanobacteria bacterium P01_F01_bin.13]